MGEHDTGERGFGRRDTGPTSFGPEAIGSDPIDPNHEAFPAGEPAGGPASAQAQARPSGQPRLPRREPETAAGSGGGRGGADDLHGQAVLEGPSRGPRRGMPIPAAPAVEHDGWRGDTIDIDETPRRRFSFQLPPYMKVAAVIAVATSFGALAGTFAATSFAPEPAAPAVVRVPDDGALRATVADLQRDVAGLRTSLENSTKALQTQTAKLTERMERTERAQAEPAQKLARLGEAIERLEKRAGQTASQVQGSGAPPTTLQAQAAAAQAGQPGTVQASSAQAAPPPVAVASADVTGSLGDPRPPAPPVVNGWVVRDVRRGIALLEGRYGYVEVEPGDRLPDGLRVESIRKQDGRWIVVTSRGLIVAR